MKKGFSLIGLLIVVLLIGILLKISLAPYKKATVNNQPQHIQTQSQAKQTADRVRATLNQAQKAAQQRVNAAEGF